MLCPGRSRHEGVRCTDVIVRDCNDHGSAVHRFTLHRIRDMTSSSNLASAKSDLRRAMTAQRDALPPTMRSAAAEAIAARAFPLPIRPGLIVSGFMPMRSEINPLPLMKRLARAGAQPGPSVTGRAGGATDQGGWVFG